MRPLMDPKYPLLVLWIADCSCTYVFTSIYDYVLKKIIK